jgi:hypothetical protein
MQYSTRAILGVRLFAILVCALSHPLSAMTRATRIDFDGEGKSDMAVYRASDGTWHWLSSGTGNSTDTSPFGLAGDIPVPPRRDHTAGKGSSMLQLSRRLTIKGL